jgi:hypothetical protein
MIGQGGPWRIATDPSRQTMHQRNCRPVNGRWEAAFSVGTEANPCDGCHRPLVSGESTLSGYFVVRLGVVGRSVVVSITTIIVIMLAAALVVAGLLWAEWGHE